MARDNGRYLSMTKVLRLWSMGSGPTCTTKLLLLELLKPPLLCLGREPIWVSLDSHVALGVMGLKKVVIALCRCALCGYTIVLQQVFPMSLEF